MQPNVVRKAVACVVRDVAGASELLVFDHPTAGTQIPKGTMEPGEDVAAAALRELAEESGVRDAVVHGLLGVWTRTAGAGPREQGAPERHDWHVVLVRPRIALGDRWDHIATGSPEEEGLVFRFRWVRVDDALPARLHPLFGAVAEILRRAVR